jgi:hypothetical protein
MEATMGAFFCSYLVVRGVSLLVGGFICEKTLAVNALMNSVQDLTLVFVVYTSAILICTFGLLWHKYGKTWGYKQQIDEPTAVVTGANKPYNYDE